MPRLCIYLLILILPDLDCLLKTLRFFLIWDYEILLNLGCHFLACQCHCQELIC